jgi:hypothetical protein
MFLFVGRVMAKAFMFRAVTVGSIVNRQERMRKENQYVNTASTG